MITERRKFLLLVVFISVIIIGGVWLYFQSGDTKHIEHEEESTYSQEDYASSSSVKSPTSTDQKKEIVQTETVMCAGEEYIFELSLEDNRTYYNNIYRNSRSSDNLLVHEIASRAPGATPKRVLAAPADNCDRVFLTAYSPESEVTTLGIYEWRLDNSASHELLSFKEFHGAFLPRPFDGIDVVASDGVRVIVAQREDGELGGCNARILRLYNLREDDSKTLVRLTENESLDTGASGEFGYCEPNYGWVNNDEIFYDVYDATKPLPYPPKERRTLKIE